MSFSPRPPPKFQQYNQYPRRAPEPQLQPNPSPKRFSPAPRPNFGPPRLPAPPVQQFRPFSSGSAPFAQRRKSYQPDDKFPPQGNATRCSSAPPPPLVSPTTLDFDKQKSFQTKLDAVSVTPLLRSHQFHQVLSNKATFLKSAMASFRQFDTDGDGKLEFREVQKLMEKLIDNLQLPSLDERMLHRIFKRFDAENSNYLKLSQFQLMYWELLQTIKEKFYPTRKVKVRRSCFVGRRDLSGDQNIEKLFTFEKRLGAGSFGEVFLVREKASGFQRVCKIINKDLSKIPMEQIEAEIDVLKKLDHPNIIKVFDVYADYNSIYIIMETCDGGELADRISKTFEQGFILTEKYVANVMRQLLEAVNYFHTALVAHKDLKPENILYHNKSEESSIKVIDFGLAELFDRQEHFSQNAAGTYLYMAPEVLDYVVTLKCDIWSCGCIMFQLFTGEVPFPGDTLEEVERKLRYSEPDYTKLSGLPISGAAVDLLKRMLCRDLNQRYSAQQRYRRQSNLKNVLTNMLAHQLNVTGGQVRQINDVFKALDVDGNGLLSKAELADGLKRVGFPPHEISQIIHALDVDASDSVSYTEFLAACYTWRESELNVVWTAFSKMDRDDDGKITVDEFIECLTSAPKSGTDNKVTLKTRIAHDERELRKMAREIDKNGDGVLDWDEFLEYMRCGMWSWMLWMISMFNCELEWMEKRSHTVSDLHQTIRCRKTIATGTVGTCFSRLCCTETVFRRYCPLMCDILANHAGTCTSLHIVANHSHQLAQA
ncbi:calcium-dependent protein kinase 6-like [Condylostylus longicornis]|uniref:calcium-dependent protein kinase 6-like n=1 Tax=Condylostylus longicornis TaxID=2530218 RepID=UPI00244E52D0|nr:calcium-dependent protein kinase 6-like [Condylostylus longicornis]